MEINKTFSCTSKSSFITDCFAMLRHFKIFDSLEVNTQAEIINLFSKFFVYVIIQKVKMSQ